MGTTTLQTLRQGLSERVGDWRTSNPSSAGAVDGTTTVDTDLKALPNDWFNGWYEVWKPGVSREIQRVTDFVSSSGSLTHNSPSFTGQVLAADTYELHRYDPTLKHEALNESFQELYPFLFLEDHDQAVVTADNQWQYTPTSDIVNVRHILVQTNQTYADYPYRLLYRGRDWYWRDNEGVLKIQFRLQPPTASPALKLEIVHVKPYSSLSADTGTIATSDRDDLWLLYTGAAKILHEKLASQSVGAGREYHLSEAGRFAKELVALKGRHRKRWPSDYYLLW